MDHKIIHADCREAMADTEKESVDAVVTDPPYGYNFMGKQWDHGVPGVEFWQAAIRVLKPGGHLLAFGGTRTHHRLMCAIEDAGFEIRDCMMWLYGCLSDDTEILTDTGWELYHKNIANHRVLGYNLDEDTFEWQSIQEVFVYDYCDTAYNIHSDSTDQVVSKNHRCIVEQDGAYVFQLAEEAARQQEIHIPILESLQGMPLDIPVLDTRAGGQKQNMLKTMCGKSGQSHPVGKTNTNECAEGDGENPLCCLQEEHVESSVSCQTSKPTDMLATMQRETTRKGMGQARTQGARSLDRTIQRSIQTENEWGEQSSVEGRRDVLPQTREIQTHQVHPVPERVHQHGAQGRVRNGTPLTGSKDNGPLPMQQGGRTPHRPQPTEQYSKQPSVICIESGPQTVRASRFAKTDLARIDAIHYEGVMWCVRVPLGAFVARRNGNIFITGNSGFPKSHNISKAIDKAAGAKREVVGSKVGQPGYSISPGKGGPCYEGRIGGAGDSEKECEITAPATDDARTWDGWGTALKPAWEPIILARKPFTGTVADNVLKHGTGGVNVDGCRIDVAVDEPNRRTTPTPGTPGGMFGASGHQGTHLTGRFPANVILDEDSGRMLDEQSGERPGATSFSRPKEYEASSYRVGVGDCGLQPGYADTGGASRFFYCAKASRAERTAGCGDKANKHPTVKPVALMRYLCRLITPPNGLILDPFCGSGSTGVAAVLENFNFIGMDNDEEACNIAEKRLQWAQSESIKESAKPTQTRLLDD